MAITHLGSELPAIAIRALAGGLLVVLFALLAQVLKPRMFSGIFGAAPAVAIASLGLIALKGGPAQAVPDAAGMLIGVAGMVAYCVAASFLVARLGGLAGSALSWAAWFGAAIGLYLLVGG